LKITIKPNAPAVGSIIARIMLNNIPGCSLSSLPGGMGNGFRMLGGA